MQTVYDVIVQTTYVSYTSIL